MKQINIDNTDYSHYDYIDDVLRAEDVHEARKLSTVSGGNAFFFIIAIIVTILHTINLYVAVFKDGSLVTAAIIHLIITVVVCIIAYGQYKKGGESPFLALLAISSAVSGIFGSVGALFSLILFGIFRNKALSFKEWFELIFPSDLISNSENIYNNIENGTDENPNSYGVMPFLEIMNIGSEAQKRNALSKMGRNFHPSLSPAFRVALKDDSNAIRVQAATSVAKIENQFMKKLERIELAREKEPNNHHITFALAKYYDDYAYTGILDTEREMLNREKAIDAYKTYLQYDSNNGDAWSSIGRLLFRSGKYEESIDWFKQAMERGWRMKNIIMWQMEALFKIKNYRGLRELIKEHGSLISGNDELPTHMHDVVKLWSATSSARMSGEKS